MKFVNLTPHALRFRREVDDCPEPLSRDLVIEPDGRVARLEQTPLRQDNVGGIPVRRIAFTGRILDLPEPQPTTVYIVSLLVAEIAVMQGRTDVMSPDGIDLDEPPFTARGMRQYVPGDVAWREQYDATTLTGQ